MGFLDNNLIPNRVFYNIITHLMSLYSDLKQAFLAALQKRYTYVSLLLLFLSMLRHCFLCFIFTRHIIKTIFHFEKARHQNFISRR